MIKLITHWFGWHRWVYSTGYGFRKCPKCRKVQYCNNYNRWVPSKRYIGEINWRE